MILCSNDLYSELFSKVLFKLFKVLDCSRNEGQFENSHFLIPAITEKKGKMMHFEIIRILDNASTSIDELWRNVSTSLRPIKPKHDFGKDFVIHSFSSVVNRELKHVTF